MKKVIHFLLGLVAFIFLPIFWIGMNISGCKVTLIEIYTAWLDYWKSGEPWGPFDE